MSEGKQQQQASKKLDKQAKYELKQKLKKEKQNGEAKSKSKSSSQAPQPQFEDPTKPGEKKVIQDFTTPAFKSYVPKNVSSSWYEYWKAIGLFDEVDGAGEISTYSITSFPQKLNGANHLGNAFQQVIQDALARYNRMNNVRVSRIQAFHDGGIAVEDALETKLLNDKKSKYSLSKDEFLEKTSELAQRNLTHTEKQIQKLGIFTSTNHKYNTADFNAREITKGLFIQLYRAGLIERRPSMINWSYYLRSPVPDTDIKYMNVKGKTLITVPGYDEQVEFGVINDLIYKIENSEEYLVIATTKPETMFADVAVLIHPEDTRYQHLVGKNAIHPVSGKLLPIVFDDELVNIEFGTGAVRLAPSNNLKDYKIGLKYGFEFIQIFNSDGTLNKNCGEGWEGLKRFEARKKILETLKAKGLFISQKDNPMRIQISLKTGDVVEKRLHSHWWLRTQNLLATNSDLSKKVVGKLEQLKVLPAIYKEKILEEIEDFETTDLILSTEKTLLSSSAAPAYYVELEGANNDTNFNINDYWVVAQNEKEAEVEAKKKFNNVKLLRKDEDDIESWFFEASSPIVSLQKENTQAASELVYSFQPHDLIVGAASDHDFKLLAKSIMVSLILTNGDKMPFREVLIHPAAADFNERKLSKRLGNAFDPLFVVDGYGHTEITSNFTEFAIANDKELKKLIKAFHTKFPKGFNELGADVFRLYFLRNLQGEGTQTLNEKFVFNNLAQIDNEKKDLSKIYQLVKFSILELTNANEFEQFAKSDFEVKFNYDKWILGKLSKLVTVLTKSIKAKDFSQYISSINSFWVSDVNNVYFEVVKNKLLSLHEDDYDRLNSKKILYYVIETALRLYHPVAPFITEELWQRLTAGKFPSIELQNFPNADAVPIAKNKDDDIKLFEQLLSLNTFINQHVANYGIPKNNEVVLRAAGSAYELLESNKHILGWLNKKIVLLSVIHKEAEILNEKDYVFKEYNSSNGEDAVTVYLLVNGLLDVNKEYAKNASKLAKLQKQKDAVEGLQNGKDYATKASQELKEKHKAQLLGYSKEIDLIEEINNSLKKFKIDG